MGAGTAQAAARAPTPAATTSSRSPARYAATAHSDQAVADLEALLDGSLTYDGLELGTDLRWLLLEGLARTGHADEERIAAELDNDNTISGQEHAAACRAARPTAEAKAAAWDQAMVDPEVPNETHRSVVWRSTSPASPSCCSRTSRSTSPASTAPGTGSGAHKAAVALEGMFPRILASAELLAQVDAYLETASANPGALRKVTEGRADVARALAAQAKDAEQG